jgi:Glycosyl transferase family 2
MTGGDPQFLVRGPFARGIWEWELRAGVRAETPGPALQIFHAPDGVFNEAGCARFLPLPRDPAVRVLRFWLPYDAAVLRFDPSDAPGTLVLGDVTARRRGRLPAVVHAFARQARRRGASGVRAWLRLLAGAARDGHLALRARLVDLITADEGPDNAEWIAATTAARADKYRATAEPGLLSILTTVYDTPAPYLRELAESLAAQTWRDYEWILLDNGSRSAGTREALQAIAADPRVTLVRADANLGILGGNRHVLERATGRYVLPVDSDDFLPPDALAIVAAVLQRDAYPPLAYSDEDKLRSGRHVDPFEKPDWDPVLLRNCAYIAHLCAIRRDDALRLGVYTDPGAEGCHDWDTFLRFWRAGLAPVHIPEILYSWRMHGGSTAANVDAKDYVIASQRHVLKTHLAETGLADRFTVERSPLFPASPDWWIRRRRLSPPPIAIVVRGDGAVEPAYPFAHVVRADQAEPLLRAWQRAAGFAPSVVVFDTRVTPASDEWIWEMAGLKESFPDAAIIGGRVLDASRMLADSGRAADDPGYFGIALKQRSAVTVPLALAMFDSAWLLTIDPAPFDALDREGLAAALAACARHAGWRVVVSPFVEAIANG